MDRMREDAQSRGIRTLRVTYEDLVKDKGAGLERVAKLSPPARSCDAAGFTYTGEGVLARRPPAPHVVLRQGRCINITRHALQNSRHGRPVGGTRLRATPRNAPGARQAGGNDARGSFANPVNENTKLKVVEQPASREC